MTARVLRSALLASTFALVPHIAAAPLSSALHVNSIDMKLVRIEPGRFRMGFEGQRLHPEILTRKGYFPHGDLDEQPARDVTISQPFYLGTFEVTNAQYERFDPSHRRYRGRYGYSTGDNDAVTFVSWYDAVRFCEWLSNKENLHYRLPTEAEWEYACRAGTTTPFSTGARLPSSFRKKPLGPPPASGFEQVSLGVGETPANAWGLFDMHGNLEEWCQDTYGPYVAGYESDPVGPRSGDFKVTRGGSHSTATYYLRSSNRLGSLPDDRDWTIGFRVAVGPRLHGRNSPPAQPARYRLNVVQDLPTGRHDGPNPRKPYFRRPREFVKIPRHAEQPFFGRHNHFTAVTPCPNGDLLAAWFSCQQENSRELLVACSRLRFGTDDWEPPSILWNTPDRNDHTHALWTDSSSQTIYHFNAFGVEWRNCAVMMRTSTDNGAHWSTPRLILPDHEDTRIHLVIPSLVRTPDGTILLPSDARGGSTLFVSRDRGLTWGRSGGIIQGIHAGVAQLDDGRLLGFGRRKNIDGRMPKSVSSDLGETWTSTASAFPPISYGQRCVLLKLTEGPLFFASFGRRITITDASGTERSVSGLFGAVSFDGGETWPHRRLISDDGDGRTIGTLNGHPTTLDAYSAEPVGYLATCQSADGVIHLLSSRQQYAFNFKWLTTPPRAVPPLRPQPRPRRAETTPTRLALREVCAFTSLPSEHAWRWNFEAGDEGSVAARLPGGGFKLRTPDDLPCLWRNLEGGSYHRVDATQGLTVELRARVTRSTPGERGVDLEVYDGFGSRYAITISRDSVHWYEGEVFGSGNLPFSGFTPLAAGLDNGSAMHAYRLAVRGDRIAEIYRDDQLLGVHRAEYRTPRDPYIILGAGRGVEAEIKHLAFELGVAAPPARGR
jgi:sulfatase modifying factor 1